MMDRLMRVIVAIVALASASTTQAAQVSDMAPCAPNAAPETSTLESFLIVHVVCSDVLLEIPAAMLEPEHPAVYTEFAALSTGGSEYAPGSAIDSRVVRWRRVGNKVALLTVNYDNWAGESVALQQGDRRDLAAHRDRGVRCGEGGRRRSARHRHHLAVHDQLAQGLRARVQAALSHGTRRWPAFAGPERPGISEKHRDRLLPDLDPRREGSAQASQGRGSTAGSARVLLPDQSSCCCPRSRCWPAARTSAWAIFSHALQRLQHRRAPRGQQSRHHPLSAGEEGSRCGGLGTGDTDRVLPEPGDPPQVASLSQTSSGAVARSSGGRRDSRTPSSPGMHRPRRKTPTGIRATCATR